MFKLICLAGAVATTAGAPVELPTSNVHTQAGQFTTLRAGSAYQASAFPLKPLVQVTAVLDFSLQARGRGGQVFLDFQNLGLQLLLLAQRCGV